MRQRMKEYPHTCRLESVIYEHGTHFIFPESMLKTMLPIGSGIFMKMAFQGARKYPKECQRARLDIDKRVKNAVAEWKSRKENGYDIKEKSMKNAYELAETILKSRPDKNGELKSSDSFTSIELYGISVCKKVQDMKFCECFHLENASGTGMITLYHVFQELIWFIMICIWSIATRSKSRLPV